MKFTILILFLLSQLAFSQDTSGNYLKDSLGKKSYIIETLPSFPGGVEEMLRFIQMNLRRPYGNIHGKVSIQFIVTKAGELDSLKVTKGINRDADAAAMDVIKAMPKWNPAFQNGKPVDCYFNLPIDFGY